MESLEKVLADLELGSHLCCVYGDREESLSQISSFVSTGLERGEKCLYVVDDRSREDIVEFMKEQGVDVGKYLESGQLEFLTGKESYLKDDYFDPDEMIDLIESEEEKALDDGYEGLRITGEMTWVFSDLPGTEKLMEYEMNLNEFLPGSKSIALCQYNEDKFSPETLIDVIYVHPKIFLEGSIYKNPYYMPPDVFLDRLQGKVSREHYDRMKEEIRERSELENKRELFRSSIQRASPEVYWITPEGRFVYTNEMVKEKLGYSEDELEELHVWDVDPNYEEEIRKKRWEMLKEEKTMTFESEHETKGGKVYPVEITNHYLEFEGEEYEFAFARDITERKEAEERKDFLTTVLRQDLGGKYQTILGYLQLLEEEVDVPDEQKEYLEKAMEAGREGDEILGLAKKLQEIEETDWVEEKDIVKVLDQIIEDISSVAEKEGVEIEKTYPDTAINVEEDYSLNILFSQILLTRIRVFKCDTIRIDAKEREENILVRIEDDGKPLPENVVSMFSGRSYTGETTGAGGVRYYMIGQIAEYKKPKIEAKSSDLGGARFDVHLKKA